MAKPKKRAKDARKKAAELQEAYYLQSMQGFASAVKRDARMVHATLGELQVSMDPRHYLKDYPR
jgi:hypothetical protein